MKFRWAIAGAVGVTTLALTAGLAGVGISNLDKPRKIEELKIKVNETMYPLVPPESRTLPRTGPSFPSPGYEN